MSGAKPSLVVGLDHDDFLPEAKGNTPDHRNTGSALLDAVGDAGNRRMFPDIARESWEREGRRHGRSAKPTHAVDVSGHLNTAIESLKVHRACLSAPGPAVPDSPTLLNAFANQGGQRFGGTPAAAWRSRTRRARRCRYPTTSLRMESI